MRATITHGVAGPGSGMASPICTPCYYHLTIWQTFGNDSIPTAACCCGVKPVRQAAVLFYSRCGKPILCAWFIFPFGHDAAAYMTYSGVSVVGCSLPIVNGMATGLARGLDSLGWVKGMPYTFYSAQPLCREAGVAWARNEQHSYF